MTYSQKASTTFSVTSWEETVLVDIDGTGSERSGTYYPDRGITQATVGYAYSGEIEGTSQVAYVMTYKSGQAPIVAFEYFEGSIGGHEGTCVFRHTGTHGATDVHDTIEVVEGMSTGVLASLRGSAVVDIGGEHEGFGFVLRYELV